MDETERGPRRGHFNAGKRYAANNFVVFGDRRSGYRTTNSLLEKNEELGDEGCIRRTDHDLDHLVPNMPLRDVVQDLYSTDPTQEACPRSCRLYGSHPAT